MNIHDKKRILPIFNQKVFKNYIFNHFLILNRQKDI